MDAGRDRKITQHSVTAVQVQKGKRGKVNETAAAIVEQVSQSGPPDRVEASNVPARREAKLERRAEHGGFGEMSIADRQSYRTMAIQLEKSGQLFKDDGKGGLSRAKAFDLFEALEYGPQDKSIPQVYLVTKGAEHHSSESSSGGSSWKHYNAWSANLSFEVESHDSHSKQGRVDYTTSPVRRWSDLEWLAPGGGDPGTLQLPHASGGTAETYYTADGSSSSRSHHERGFISKTTVDAYHDSSWWTS